MHRRLKLLFAVSAAGALACGVAVAASSPAVSTGSPGSVTASSALLKGSVNPNGASTTYQFQFGLTTSYGVSTPLKSAGSGVKSLAVTATVGAPVATSAGALLPGTPYHYRLIATNKFGVTVGSDRTFKTHGNPPPEVATGPASQIGTSFATVSGVINPHGEATTWAFQYGLTSSYGVQTLGGVVLAGNTPVTVAQQLVGLTPGVTFHYRIVAFHGTVSMPGLDGTFVTYPSPRPGPLVQARTSPHRARTAPYTFTTSGTVLGPASIPQSVSCFQNVTVRFFLGRREVASSLVPVAPNCAFAGQTVFNRLPGRGGKHRKVHLRVLIHFRGNGYLAPADARPETAVLG